MTHIDFPIEMWIVGVERVTYPMPWAQPYTFQKGDLYDIYEFLNTMWTLVARDFADGATPFSFGPHGFEQCRILSIAKAAMLDPARPTTFVTGLTLAGAGHFTGTQPPLLSKCLPPRPNPAPGSSSRQVALACGLRLPCQVRCSSL